MLHNYNAAFCEMRPQDIDHEIKTTQHLRVVKVVEPYE